MIDRAAFLKGIVVATGGLDIWSSPSPAPLPSASAAAGGATIRVALADGTVATLDLESYLCGVVPIETSPAWPVAALEAQAIVARTYALGKRVLGRAYDVVASDADQRYGGPAAEHPASSAAVVATRGQVLTYLGGPATIFYSSCCGGHTADASELWGHAGLPYLHGVNDPYCTASPDYRWTRALTLDRARSALADRLAGTPVAADLAQPDATGRPPAVTFHDDTGASAVVSVSDLRRRFGADVVRSLWIARIGFDATQAGGSVVIEGSGRGHGVGLCQWGAHGMALAGADAATILSHFFPGTAVTGG